MLKLPENLDLLDAMTILSFFIGVENLNQNMAQTDKQELLDGVDKSISSTIQDIHDHLAEQDAKIDLILKRLEELK